MKPVISRSAACLAALIALLSITVKASAEDPPTVKARLVVAQKALKAGQTLQAGLVLQVRPKHHINIPNPPQKFLAPTKVTVKLPQGFKMEGLTWPAPRMLKLAFADKPLPFYDGTVTIGIKIKVLSGAKSGIIQGRVDFQACDDTSCLMPERATFSARVTIHR